MTQNRKSVGFWIGLVNTFRLAWLLFFDKRVPFLTKLIPIFVLLYILSPIDFVFDVIPIFGQVDDLAILTLGVEIFVALSPPTIVNLYRKKLS